MSLTVSRLYPTVSFDPSWAELPPFLDEATAFRLVLDVTYLCILVRCPQLLLRMAAMLASLRR